MQSLINLGEREKSRSAPTKRLSHQLLYTRQKETESSFRSLKPIALPAFRNNKLATQTLPFVLEALFIRVQLLKDALAHVRAILESILDVDNDDFQPFQRRVPGNSWRFRRCGRVPDIERV